MTLDRSGVRENTYCFTEPENHAGVFNGQLAGQCTEIIEYSDADESSVCNLGSIALPSFVGADGAFDHARLHRAARSLTRNLNRIIDRNFYADESMSRSNFRARPIGIGVQGLADVFAMLSMPFGSPASRRLNKDIFETIYNGFVEESITLAQEDGPYETYEGSPASRGQLQFDLWGVEPDSGRWDWAATKARLAAHGMRNSLGIAQMPTASTAQILGNNESIEPFTSNMYNRSVLSGTFQVVNRHLIADLNRLGLWDQEMKAALVRNRGSVQKIGRIPRDIKQLYRTVWEIKPSVIVEMSADRGPYICQSQSLNINMDKPTIRKIITLHKKTWREGLKTGMYYLHTPPASDAQQFSLAPVAAPAAEREAEAVARAEGASAEDAPMCTMEEGCVMCSS